MSDSLGPEVGERAPEFTAPLVTADGSTESVALSTLVADQPVLLAFYTNDFSPDCITEWCSFRDDDWFGTGEGIRVVGVSTSRPETHRKFIERLQLPFPLYSDTDLAIAESYGVKYRLFKLLARARRSCFLIDQEGVIRYKWIAEHLIDPTRDMPPLEEIKRAVEETMSRSETVDSA